MSVICCYILYVCEMLCVCYVSSSSGLLYLYMSVLCCYMLYVSYMLYVCYTSSLGGVVRIRLYIIYAHLCNHHTSYKVVVGLGSQLCTQLEVWVLGVGMSTLGAQTALYAEDRGLQVPMSLKYGPVPSSGKPAPGPDPRIRNRIQIGMFRPIRVDHTNCLQVAIKTHSFIHSGE